MEDDHDDEEEALPERDAPPPSREEFDALVAQVRRLAEQVANARA